MSKRKIMALLLAVVMVCTLFVSPALAAEGEGEPVAISDTAAPKFTDVDGHWAESAINRWAEEGIIEGDGDGTVNPQRNLKRAELATILTRLLGLKTAAPANTFSDVAANAWYADAVLKCAHAGIMLGDGTGKANPEAPIDRQQTIVMVGRALGVKPASGNSLNRFNDADNVADWAKPYMIALTDMGILNGLPTGDGAFVIAPEVNINRASTFTLLDKAIAKYVTGPCVVTVDDANKFVVINSAAEEFGTVTVTGKAAGVVVAVGTTDEVVLKDAAVGTVKVDAPVDVIISRGSNVTDLDANAAAVVTNNGAVTNLNTNADGVTFDGNKPAKVNTAKDVEPAKDSKGNEVTDKPASSGGSSGGSSVVRADVVPAPMFDQAASNAIDADKLGTVTVSSRRTALTDGVPTYEVTVTGRDIMNHNNAQQIAGHWVGFGMPAKVVAEGEAASSYTYEVNGSVVASIAGRTHTVGDKTYNTVYFSEENGGSYADYTIVVKDGEAVVANYVVKFDVTFWSIPAANVTVGTVPADHADYAQIGAYALKAEQMTVNGYDITLSGELDPAALNQGIYAYYFLQVKDDVVSKISDKKAPTFEGAYDFSGGQAVATRVLLNNELRKLTHTFTAYDANGRVQDVFEITVDATGCSVKGMKKVIFVDGETSKTVMAAGDTVTAPAVTAASTDDTFYTGKWTVGETVYAAGAEIPVTDGMTVTAERKTVGAQAASFRGEGPATGADSFDYAAAYEAAGLTFENNTIKVDAKTLLAYVADEANAAAVTALTHTVGDANYIFAGLTYAAPEGAKKVKVADTVAELAAADAIDLTAESGSVHAGQYIDYYGAAQLGDPVAFLDSNDWTACFLWLDENDAVLAVNKLTVSRETTLATFTVTFKDGDTTVAANEVDYGKKVSFVEAPAKEDAIFQGWVDADGKAVDFNAPITADVTYTAKWAAVTAVSDVEVIIGAVPQKLGITATAYADGAITFTVDKAAFQKAWEGLSDAEKTQLEHEGRLFVRVNFAVPAGVDENWTFVGSTDNGKTWRGEVKPFNKTNLNALGLDVTEEGGKIVKLGQWFGIATVTAGEGDAAPTFSFPDANTWTNLYKWTNAAGEVQYTTFELTRAVVEGDAGEA